MVVVSIRLSVLLHGSLLVVELGMSACVLCRERNVHYITMGGRESAGMQPYSYIEKCQQSMFGVLGSG